MEQVFDRRSPVELPGLAGDNSIARAPLWYAYGTGADTCVAPPWTWTEEPPPETHVPPPPPAVAMDGARSPLPLGTVDLLGRLPYPAGPVTSTTDPEEALARALVTAFGPLRREPDNPYNDHRCYPSPRCLFPVQAFVSGPERWRMLDPERHALVDLAAGPAGDRPRTIALTGRYTRIPSAYKWFRGSLVNLELGIVLRSLCIGLELFGLPGRLRLPDGSSRELLVELGLVPTWEWSLPLAIEVGEPLGTRSVRPSADRAAEPVADTAPEPALANLVGVNRVQAFSDPPAPLLGAVPTGASLAVGASSWAELLWNRTSGRMPRGLHGMGGRRCRLPADALHDSLRWLTTPPPGETLRAVYDAVTVTAVVQSIDGYADGVYRASAREAVLHHADPEAANRLQAEYGYPLAPGNGCDIRHASMIWFFSMRPREVISRFGPGGWSAAQYACGWAIQGLGLAAAAAGLYARPVGAFKEIPTQRILGLEPEEMIVLAVVVGTPRHTGGALLDLRL